MMITVTYHPDEDRLVGRVDERDSSHARVVEWSDDLYFLYVGKRVIGFQIAPFHSFVDYLPFFKLFGPEFVEWLSDVRSHMVGQGQGRDDRYRLEQRTRSGRRFESELASP